MMTRRFNMTLSELEKATQFARDNGASEFKTIALHIDNGNGIGAIIHVSKPQSDELVDITDVEAW
jgi:hypothetical protein